MKVTIDLSSDSITDLSIDELKKAKEIINVSIQNYNRNLKKKKPIQIELFGTKETISEIKTTFEKSNVSNWVVFGKEFLDIEQMGVDISFYYNSVKDWSICRPTFKKYAKDWLRHSIREINNDIKLKKLVIINGIAHNEIDYDSILNNLKLHY
jgi:hypothetical protein